MNIFGEAPSVSDQNLTTESEVVFAAETVGKASFINGGTPIIPENGKTTLYSKLNKKLYYLDDVGVETLLGGTSTAGGDGFWTFSTSLSGDPQALNVAFNNAIPASVTGIQIAKVDFNSVNQSVLLSTVRAGDQLHFNTGTGVLGAKLYTITSQGTDNGSWYSFVVSFEAQDSPTNYTAGEGLSVSIILQNPFNQQLNTTSTVEFAEVSTPLVTSAAAIELTAPSVTKNSIELVDADELKTANDRIDSNDTDITNLQAQVDNIDDTNYMRKIADSDLEMNGFVIKASSIEASTVNSVSLVEDEFLGPTLNNGGAMIGGTVFSTEYDNTVRISGINANGAVRYDSNVTGSLTQDWTVEFNMLMQYKGAGFNGICLCLHATPPLSGYSLNGGVIGDYSLVFETIEEKFKLYYGNTIINGAGDPFPPIVSFQPYNIKISLSNGGTLFKVLYDDVLISSTTVTARQPLRYYALAGITNSSNIIYFQDLKIDSIQQSLLRVDNLVTEGLTPAVTDVSDLGSATLKYKDAYFSGGVELPAGDVQTQLNDKLDKVSTTNLDMNFNDITNVANLGLAGGDVQTQLNDKMDKVATTNLDMNFNDITNVANLGLAGGDVQTQLNDKMDKVATTGLDMNFNDITNANVVYATNTIVSGVSFNDLNADVVGLKTIVRNEDDAGIPTNSTFVGKGAGGTIATGGNNDAFGESALNKCTTGNTNTAIGNRSLTKLTIGQENTGVGWCSLCEVTEGKFNTGVGRLAGSDIITGENNTCVGMVAQTGSIDAQNRIVIGANAVGDTDNECVIGSGSLTAIRPMGPACSLGRVDKPFLDLHTSGAVTCDTLTAITSITTSVINGVGPPEPVCLENDDFTGAVVSAGSGVTRNAAFWAPGQGYVRLIPEFQSNIAGQMVYDGTQLTDNWEIEIDWKMVDTAGNEGTHILIFKQNADPVGIPYMTPTNSGGYCFQAGVDNFWNPNRFDVFYNGVALEAVSALSPDMTPGQLWTIRLTCTNGTDFVWSVLDSVTKALLGQYAFTDINRGPHTYCGVSANTQGTTSTSEFQLHRFTSRDTLALGAPGDPQISMNADVTLSGLVNGITPVGGVFAQIEEVLFTSTVAPETKQMIGNGVGTLSVPANGFKVGDSFHLKCGGRKVNGNADTIQIMLKSNGFTIVDSGVIEMVGVTNAPWELEVDFTIRAIGGNGVGNINTNGQFTYTDVDVYEGFGFNSTNNTTFDTTVDNTLTLEITLSDAGNFVSMSSFVLQKVF